MQRSYLQVDAHDATLYHLSEEGIAFFTRLGVDCSTPSKSRRRFVCACLDWSERRPHLGGAFARISYIFVEQQWGRTRTRQPRFSGDTQG